MLREISRMERLSICTGIFWFCMLSSLYAGEDAPFIANDEEYAVIAAVLFPDAHHPALDSAKEPARKDDPFRYITRLDGIPSSYFSLSRQTTTGSLPDKGFDSTMVDDFNRKNAKAHQIDPVKFAAAAPKESGVTLITPKGFSMDEEPRGVRSGATYISRPGFNKAGTEAVLDVSHVAGYEMGIGYRVILEKSPRDGKWRIVDAAINRRY